VIYQGWVPGSQTLRYIMVESHESRTLWYTMVESHDTPWLSPRVSNIAIYHNWAAWASPGVSNFAIYHGWVLMSRTVWYTWVESPSLEHCDIPGLSTRVSNIAIYQGFASMSSYSDRSGQTTCESIDFRRSLEIFSNIIFFWSHLKFPLLLTDASYMVFYSNQT